MSVTTPYPSEIPPGVELILDVSYGSVKGVPLLLDLARPRERASAKLPAIVYMHGGAWQSGSKADGVPAICYYAAHGFVAASVGYRLSSQAQFPAQIEDCRCAVRFLRAMADEYGIAPARIGAMGASSGGHLAILLGLTGGGTEFADKGGWENFSSGVSAICDLFGVSDFFEMPRRHLPDVVNATSKFLGGSIDLVPERYIAANPIRHVHSAAPPFLIVHGDRDDLVPLRQSELLHAALKAAGVNATLYVVKGASHGSIEVVTPEVRSIILAFFEKHLKAVQLD
jgi:acetyl esterase/lipase